MTTLKKAQNIVISNTIKYKRKMRINKPLKIRFTRKLNETSAEVRNDGQVIYNTDYIEANRNNKTVLDLLPAHEMAHVKAGMTDGEKFKKVYKKYTGRKDPEVMPREHLEKPRFAYTCPKCKRVWFLFRKPKKAGYCSYDNTRLKLTNMSKDKYMNNNWEKIRKNNNTIP